MMKTKPTAKPTVPLALPKHVNKRAAMIREGFYPARNAEIVRLIEQENVPQVKLAKLCKLTPARISGIYTRATASQKEALVAKEARNIKRRIESNLIGSFPSLAGKARSK